MTTEIKVPSLGESISEVQIAEWHKQEGDRVEKDETIVSVDSEKATVDVPAPVAGRLVAIAKANGQTARVGDVLGTIEPGEGGDTEAAVVKERRKKVVRERGESPRVMPAAQRLLDEKGLKAGDVKATGPGGRLLKEDVVNHLAAEAGGEEGGASGAAAVQLETEEDLSEGLERAEEVVPLTPLRRTVARRLVEAQQSMAILTTFNEVDMSAVMALRKEHQEAFQKRHGVKLGLMSFFVKAVIAALKDTPRLNAEIRGEAIVLRHYCDICVAIGAGKGLVVPPLRNAERMSFAEIEATIADLARRAGENKLMPQELVGGTFTISNGGVYGSLLSTPIINPPQSGILGLHSIQERPVAREGQVVIRPMMYLALSYDHRIVDGREAVTFLGSVKGYIESPARLLIEA